MDKNPIDKIVDAIIREREYQIKKWGNHPHTVCEWITIMRGELNEAEYGWLKQSGDEKALEEILQVIATGIACLQQHGIVERQELR